MVHSSRFGPIIIVCQTAICAAIAAVAPMQFAQAQEPTRPPVIGSSQPDTAPTVGEIAGSLRSSDTDIYNAAYRSLSTLILKGDAEARVVLQNEIARSGGLVDIGQLVSAHLPHLFDMTTDDDYPPSAMRDGKEGQVALQVVFTPTGRAVVADPVNAIPNILSTISQRLVVRRARARFPLFPGRFVTGRMDILFRIKACGAPSLPPKPPGIVTIDGICRAPIINDVPVSISAVNR
jgi:hypothetical protein